MVEVAQTFPPSFADGPLSYGMALFSMSLCSALSLLMLLRFWFEARARREAWRLAANPRPEDEPFASPLTIHRMIVSCLFLMVFIGVTPDAIKYLLWGEVSLPVMHVIQEVDQILDGVTFIPFVAATLLSTWGMQVIPQQLIHETRVNLRRPTWEVLKPHAKVGTIVLLIAIGVTLAKAGV